MRKKLKSVKEILKRIDERLTEYHLNKCVDVTKDNLSNAMVNEDYFFALLYLKEDILGEELSVHDEYARIRHELDKSFKEKKKWKI